MEEARGSGGFPARHLTHQEFFPLAEPNSLPPDHVPLRVVAIGGGTGLSTLLRGLKRYVAAPSGSHSAWHLDTLPFSSEAGDPADSGSGSGGDGDRRPGGHRGGLREGFEDVAAGRRTQLHGGACRRMSTCCRVCSSIASPRETCRGHSFGNLFVAALTEITGDFALAVQMASQILATRGRIYPATNSNATLTARMDDAQPGARRDQYHGQQTTHRRVDAGSADRRTDAGDD